MPRLTPRRSVILLFTLLVIRWYKNYLHQENLENLREMGQFNQLSSNDYYFKTKTHSKTGSASKNKKNTYTKHRRIQSIITSRQFLRKLYEGNNRKENELDGDHDYHFANAQNSSSENQNYEKLCKHLPDNLAGYKNCIKRIMDLEKNYQNNACLKHIDNHDYFTKTGHQIHCEFQDFLAHYENSCPSLEKSMKGRFSKKRVIRHEIRNIWSEILISRTLLDVNKSITFIKKRIDKFALSWGVASFKIHQLHSESELDSAEIRTFTQKSNSAERNSLHQPWLNEKLSILIYANFMVNEIEAKFISETEKIQWADLVAGLYILGHNITIVESQSEALKLFGITNLQLNFSEVCPEKSPIYDKIICDLEAAKVIKKYAEAAIDENNFKNTSSRNLLVKNWDFIKCRMLVLAGYPIDTEFNHPTYFEEDKSKNYKSERHGHLGLDTKQYLIPYPESDDNTFLGFVVHNVRHNPDKENRVLIHGNTPTILTGRKDLLMNLLKINDLGFSIESTISIKNINVKLSFPTFIKNHGQLHSLEDFEKIFNSTRILIGFGSPTEDYLPLEALSHGIVYIQPSFETEGNSTMKQRTVGNRPNLIQLKSQFPYLTEKVGPPYVYTLDYRDKIKFQKVIESILEHPQNEPFIPLEYQVAEYLNRLDKLLSTRNFCNMDSFSNNNKLLEMEMHISYFNNGTGKSCSDTCKFHKLDCDVDFFFKINEDLQAGGNLLCRTTSESMSSINPSINLTSSTCYVQKDQYLLNCRAKPEKDMARFCPCVRSII